MKKKYILFDNDGVLVETEKWYYEANLKTLKEIGFDLPINRYLRMMAEGRTTWEDPIKAGYSHDEILNFRSIRDKYYQEFITTKDIEIQNVENVLDLLSKNFKMAIVTTSRRVDFELIHSKREITKYMDFILCEEDYERAKPFPDPYLKAIEIFNCSKEDAVIIEDSERGLTSAVNANIDCITVYNEFTKTHNFNKSILKIKNLNELVDILKVN